MPEFTGHRDIRSYIRTIWRWKLLIIVLVLGAPAVAYFLERNKPTNDRRAHRSRSPDAANSTVTLPGNSFSRPGTSGIARMMTTTPVANIAGQLMKPPVTGSAHRRRCQPAPTTRTSSRSPRLRQPETCRCIANAFAKAVNVNDNDVTRPRSSQRSTATNSNSPHSDEQRELPTLERSSQSSDGLEGADQHDLPLEPAAELHANRPAPKRRPNSAW